MFGNEPGQWPTLKDHDAFFGRKYKGLFGVKDFTLSQQEWWMLNKYLPTLQLFDDNSIIISLS